MWLTNLVGRLRRIAELDERLRHRVVDDLDHAPPTSSLLHQRRSGSMPVVSQSIMKPIVPVGAITVNLRVAVARHCTA